MQKALQENPSKLIRKKEHPDLAVHGAVTWEPSTPWSRCKILEDEFRGEDSGSPYWLRGYCLQGVWDTWEEHLNIVLDSLWTLRGKKKSREREGLTSLRRKQGSKSIKGASEYSGLMLHGLVSRSLSCLLAKFHFYLFSCVRNSLLCMHAYVWVCNRQSGA